MYRRPFALGYWLEILLQLIGLDAEVGLRRKVSGEFIAFEERLKTISVCFFLEVSLDPSARVIEIPIEVTVPNHH